jgi:hypothetical protein
MVHIKNAHVHGEDIHAITLYIFIIVSDLRLLYLVDDHIM